MSTLGNTTVNGVVTQTAAASQPQHLLRLGEAQTLLSSVLAGNWNNAATFTQGMLVTWANAVYLLQAATSLNQPPDQNPLVWTLVLAGGVNGAAGTSTWVAFASDGAGTGFSLTAGSGLNYLGFATGVTPPNTVGSYSNWTKFAGADGAPGATGATGAAGPSAYLYVGYASDASGTGFSLTPGTSLNYLALKNSSTVIATPSASDFTGLWKQYGSAIASVGSPLTLSGGALGINAASTNTANSVVQRDGSGNFTAGTATLTAAVIGSATLAFASSALQINTPLTVGGVLTVGSLSGILSATAGVISGSADTNSLPEGAVNLATPSGNAYFTRARVLATPLTGVSSTVNILATDTLLAALGKLDAAVGGTLAGATFTGGVTLPSLTVSQIAATSGTPNAVAVTGAAHTGLAGSTEAVDVNFNLARTVQFSTGAIALQRAGRISPPTYAFAAASTITDAVTLGITGAPVAGANATITNSHGLKIQSNALAAGNVNGYGLFVDAPTGAANNFCAAFNTGDVLVNAGWVRAAAGYGLKVAGNPVVTNRQTGWAAATGTATRTSFATGSVTLPQLAQAVKALVDDLLAHGLIGA